MEGIKQDLVKIGGTKLNKGLTNNNVASSGSLPKVYIKTFGCQMNVYDSDKIMNILGSSYQPIDEAEKADLIIVNTCSVREKAENKLYSLVGSFRPLKTKNPDLLIGVGGCVAQQEGKKVLSRSKEVDFVFGTHNLSMVPELVNKLKSGLGRQVAVEYRDQWEELPVGLYNSGRASEFISISRGCNKNCTYCIVPTTRGPEVSRPIKEILQEAELAAKRGTKEVILLGQTVNSYGLDLSPRIKFSELLKEISRIDDIKRIRFTSPHPQEIRDDFYRLLEENPKICRHVHMPLQSGSNRVLKSMNRNYRKSRYLSIIEGLKSVCPTIGITTDIIVGFPGETREDFEETLEVMREVKFDSSYSFAYSPRPGTKAATMEGQIAEDEKLSRLNELQELQDQITAERLEGWMGQTVEVLIDGFTRHDNEQLKGRTSENLLVHLSAESINGVASNLDAYGPGMFVNARIYRLSRYTLHGFCQIESIGKDLGPSPGSSLGHGLVPSHGQG